MIGNNWLDDVDSLAGNSSSLALSVIKSKSHPKLIPSFLGHDSLSKIISNIYHWMTQGIHSWPGRIFLHTPSLPLASVSALVFWKCVLLLGLLDTRQESQTLTQECQEKEVFNKNMFSQGSFLNKLKWGMFQITGFKISSPLLYWLSSLFYSSESEPGFIFVLDFRLQWRCTDAARTHFIQFIACLNVLSIPVSPCPHHWQHLNSLTHLAPPAPAQLTLWLLILLIPLPANVILCSQNISKFQVFTLF